MITPEVQTYIQEQLKAGVTREAIRDTLAANGWNAKDIAQALPGLEVPKPIQSKMNTGWLVGIAVVVAALGAVGSFFAFSSSPTQTQSPQTATSAPAVPAVPVAPKPTPVEKPCADYSCLLPAAAQCKPIVATISYSGLEVFPDVLSSGKVQYQITKTAGVNDCTLTSTTLETTLRLSDAMQKEALASGATEAEIAAELNNKDSQSTLGMQTTCTGTPSAVEGYLSDAQKGVFKSESDLLKNTTTYTTSAGHTLTCTVVMPKAQ